MPRIKDVRCGVGINALGHQVAAHTHACCHLSRRLDPCLNRDRGRVKTRGVGYAHEARAVELKRTADLAWTVPCRVTFPLLFPTASSALSSALYQATIPDTTAQMVLWPLDSESCSVLSRMESIRSTSPTQLLPAFQIVSMKS
jgi:hypothetical protein